MIQAAGTAADNALTAGHVEDIELVASKMARVERRAFQAEMTPKYCEGKPRRAETLFGWNRDAVELGLHEKRTGVVCLSAPPEPACRGRLQTTPERPWPKTVVVSVGGEGASKWCVRCELRRRVTTSGIGSLPAATSRRL